MPPSNRFFFLLVAIFLLFALIDIFTGETGLTTDGTNYLRLAENIFNGNGYTLHGESHTVFPPGYPLLIGFFSLFVKNYLVSGQIISILSTIGAAYVLLTILRKKKSNSLLIMGFVAIFLFNWTIIRLSVLTLSDPLYILLMLLNLKLVLMIFDRRENISNHIIIALGLINGYMYLVRTEGILVSVINLIFLVALMFKKRPIRLHKIILYIFCFLLLSIPYVLYLHTASGRWTLAGKSMNLTICEKITSEDPLIWEKNGYRLLEDGKNVLITSAATSDFNIKEYILSNSNELMKRMIKNAISYLRVILFSFAFTAIFFAYISKSIRETKTIYLLLLFSSSLYLLSFSIGRYWISYFPVLLLLSYFGASSFDRKNHKSAVISVVILSAIFANLYAGRDEFAGIFRTKKTYGIEMEAAAWIDVNIDEEAVLVLRKPEVAYLSNRQWLRFPWFEHRDEFIDYMRRNNLEYFILSDEERYTRPFLEESERNGTINDYAVLVEQIDYCGSNLKIMKIRDDYRNQ